MASLAPISGNLGADRASHLLRRATFGATRAEIESLATQSPAQAIGGLLTFPSIPAAPEDGNSGKTWDSKGKLLTGRPEINAWWLHQAIDPTKPKTAFFKLTFFLHTSATVSHKSNILATMWYYHLRLLMIHTDKSYKTLIRKMSVDNAMGEYLNIASNVAGHPNENYARELLELFTVGKGPQVGAGDYTNYTEDDIREAARILTGIQINKDWDNAALFDPNTSMPIMQPDPSKHDSGKKQFSYAFQDKIINGSSNASGMLNELDELIDMIFDSEAVSIFIIRKLYRYYVHYNITAEIEDDIIKPLASTFRNSGYLFKPVLEQLFMSEHFYDEDDQEKGDEIIGGLIKSPLELMLHSLIYFQAYIPDPSVDLDGLQSWLSILVQNKIRPMGMEVFAPSSVAGYEPMYQEPDFNRYWINASTLPYRYDYVYSEIVNHQHKSPLPYGKFNIIDFVEDPTNIPVFTGKDALGTQGPHEGARIASHLVSELVKYLLPTDLEPDRMSYFLNDLLLGQISEINWAFEWDNYKATGNEEMVRNQLEILVKGILQSPEFQLG